MSVRTDFKFSDNNISKSTTTSLVNEDAYNSYDITWEYHNTHFSAMVIQL